MEKKLYVGNIAFQVTEEQIREMFEKVGKVESVNLITDRDTGRPKGFGFVEMASEEDARNAIAQLNGSVFMERALTVSEAKPQKPTRQRGYDGFGGGAGKGGYGGGGRSGGPRRR
jgi:RNA recognition motif-containing protein